MLRPDDVGWQNLVSRGAALTVKSVFVVAPLFPWPPHDGGRIGILYRLRELHRNGIRVTLFYAFLPEESPRPSPLDEYCEEIIAVPRPEKGHEPWRALRLPYGVGSRYLPQLRKRLQIKLAAAPPDVVVLEQTHSGVFRRDLGTNVPVLLGVHNLEFRTIKARARNIGRTLRGLAYRVEAWRMERYENRLFRRSDWAALLFVSKDERRVVEANYAHLRGRCYDLPPGCDLPPPPVGLAARQLNLAFVGALWFENNVDGLLWFVRAVWPAVRRAIPDAILTVAGWGAAPRLELVLRAVPGIRYLGFVPEVGPVYANARGVILPIRGGAGVKVKTVEALATGLPCIGTLHAFEGLDLDLGTVCVASDDPMVLAQGCVRALRLEEPALDQGSTARRFVERTLTWEAIGRRYLKTLEMVAAEQHAT